MSEITSTGNAVSEEYMLIFFFLKEARSMRDAKEGQVWASSLEVKEKKKKDNIVIKEPKS